jgi:hypothetical protein
VHDCMHSCIVVHFNVYVVLHEVRANTHIFYNGTKSTGSSQIRLIIIVLVFPQLLLTTLFFPTSFCESPQSPAVSTRQSTCVNFSPSSSILHAPRFCRFLALDFVVFLRNWWEVPTRSSFRHFGAREVLYGGADSSILL